MNHLHSSENVVAEQRAAGSIFAYRTPAAAWTDGLPLGNGRQALMLISEANGDRWQINDATCWSGSPVTVAGDDPDKRGTEIVSSIRESLFAGDLAAAEEHAAALQFGQAQSYQPLAELQLTWRDQQPRDDIRWLDVSRGTAGWETISSSGEGGDWAGPGSSAGASPAGAAEVFASAAADVIVGRYQWGTPRTVEIDLQAAHRDSGLWSISQRDHGLELVTRMPSSVAPDLSTTPGHTRYDPTPGSSITAVLALGAQSDGTLERTDSGLRFVDARHLTLVISTETDFVDPAAALHGDVERLLASTWERVNNAQSRDVAEIARDHRQAFAELADRFRLSLGDQQRPPVVWVDDVLQRSEQALPTELVTAAVHFGRYLLIAGSRSGSPAIGLQGLWNEHVRPAWGGAYTTNINAEMNFWPAGPANLGETVEPLFRLVENLQRTGATTAERVYGSPGWVSHHNSDIWGFSLPIGTGKARPKAVLWPMAGAWLTLELVEQLRFAAADDAERSDLLWRALDGAVDFALSWLIDLPDGSLGTAPSTSPENSYLHDGREIGTGMSSTMDIALLRALLVAWLEFAESRTDQAADQSRIDAVRSARERLPLPSPTAQGRYPEWHGNPPEAEPDHRHQSHLWDIYPGDAVRVTDASQRPLIDAAIASLKGRGELSTGWSLAWRVSLWARLRRAEDAMVCLRQLLRRVPDVGGAAGSSVMTVGGGSYRNLFSAHPPFQIDGNFGLVAGVVELLLQSHDRLDGVRVIDVLPTLPQEWSDGELRGAGARGGVTVDIRWRAGKPVETVLTSPTAQHVLVRWQGEVQSIDLPPQQPVRVEFDDSIAADSNDN